jgi:hypothetical protein
MSIHENVVGFGFKCEGFWIAFGRCALRWWRWQSSSEGFGELIVCIFRQTNGLYLLKERDKCSAYEGLSEKLLKKCEISMLMVIW